jgi:hypothetical protein
MPTNEIGEKIYFGDTTSKVTNVRVTCNHITVPISKIESVDVVFRIEAFSISVILFLCSFLLLFFISPIPPAFDTAYLFFTVIIIAATLMWLVLVFKNYTELLVYVSGRGLVIHSSSMMKKDYICKIANSIGDAISDEKKYQEMKKSGETVSSIPFNSSETMRLKLMLDDYDKLTGKKQVAVEAKDI